MSKRRCPVAQLEVSDRRIGDVAVVTVQGRLIADQRACPFCDRVDELLAAGVRKFLIDLSHTNSIDSAGVGALVWKYRTVTGRGGSFKLLRPGDRVRKVLGIARLDTVFEIFDSEASAVAGFREAIAAPSLAPSPSRQRHRTA
jgi:anti-sigma B factor antagonist